VPAEGIKGIRVHASTNEKVALLQPETVPCSANSVK
jgi:hypothetical protein